MHAESIREKLTRELQPRVLEVENESHLHAGPAMESHFKLVVVSEAFEGQRRIQRHRQVFTLLEQELATGVHALGLHLYTPIEWQALEAQAPASPKCRGGS